MARGMDHYKLAEELAKTVERTAYRYENGELSVSEVGERMIALAQVHATLALADYTGDQVGRTGP